MCGNIALPAVSSPKLSICRGVIPNCYFRRLSIDCIINERKQMGSSHPSSLFCEEMTLAQHDPSQGDSTRKQWDLL